MVKMDYQEFKGGWSVFPYTSVGFFETLVC